MHSIKLTFFLFLLSSILCFNSFAKQQSRNYYLSSSGDDNNDGSKTHPWKTIDKLNNTLLHAGDTVLFKSGDIFPGHILLDSSKTGKQNKPLIITSYGNSKAVINGNNTTALTIINSSFIKVSNIAFAGSGRKDGNTMDGVKAAYSHDIILNEIDVKGFQKSGVVIYACVQVKVSKVYAHDNGSAGISIDGEYQKRNTENIQVVDCKAENNPGDPTNFGNHSGNGIIAGNCKNVLIEYCSATNNGWDMPRTGNGPVGIWCYEADSVVIQHCISYRNKTSKGGGDGGGFDLDGGVTNSVIQYCLSYENEGSAFGIFQYDGASNWHNNTIRFCISENDGAVSPAQASVFIWNSSMDTAQFSRCYFYNNTIYNECAAAISYEPQSANTRFYFFNNIFIGKDSLVTGKETNTTYLGNNWYSLQSGFNVGGNKDFKVWALQHGKEQINKQLIGWNSRTVFKKTGNTSLTDPRKLKAFYNFRPENNTAKKGIDLYRLFKIDTGLKDFNGFTLKRITIGACIN